MKFFTLVAASLLLATLTSIRPGAVVPTATIDAHLEATTTYSASPACSLSHSYSRELLSGAGLWTVGALNAPGCQDTMSYREAATKLSKVTKECRVAPEANALKSEDFDYYDVVTTRVGSVIIVFLMTLASLIVWLFVVRFQKDQAIPYNGNHITQPNKAIAAPLHHLVCDSQQLFGDTAVVVEENPRGDEILERAVNTPLPNAGDDDLIPQPVHPESAFTEDTAISSRLLAPVTPGLNTPHIPLITVTSPDLPSPTQLSAAVRQLPSLTIAIPDHFTTGGAESAGCSADSGYWSETFMEDGRKGDDDADCSSNGAVTFPVSDSNSNDVQSILSTAANSAPTSPQQGSDGTLIHSFIHRHITRRASVSCPAISINVDITYPPTNFSLTRRRATISVIQYQASTESITNPSNGESTQTPLVISSGSEVLAAILSEKSDDAAQVSPSDNVVSRTLTTLRNRHKTRLVAESRYRLPNCSHANEHASRVVDYARNYRLYRYHPYPTLVRLLSQNPYFPQELRFVSGHANMGLDEAASNTLKPVLPVSPKKDFLQMEGALRRWLDGLPFHHEASQEVNFALGCEASTEPATDDNDSIRDDDWECEAAVFEAITSERPASFGELALHDPQRHTPSPTGFQSSGVTQVLSSSPGVTCKSSPQSTETHCQSTLTPADHLSSTSFTDAPQFRLPAACEPPQDLPDVKARDNDQECFCAYLVPFTPELKEIALRTEPCAIRKVSSLSFSSKRKGLASRSRLPTSRNNILGSSSLGSRLFPLVQGRGRFLQSLRVSKSQHLFCKFRATTAAYFLTNATKRPFLNCNLARFRMRPSQSIFSLSRRVKMDLDSLPSVSAHPSIPDITLEDSVPMCATVDLRDFTWLSFMTDFCNSTPCQKLLVYSAEDESSLTLEETTIPGQKRKKRLTTAMHACKRRRMYVILDPELEKKRFETKRHNFSSVRLSACFCNWCCYHPEPRIPSPRDLLPSPLMVPPQASIYSPPRLQLCPSPTLESQPYGHQLIEIIPEISIVKHCVAQEDDISLAPCNSLPEYIEAEPLYGVPERMGDTSPDPPVPLQFIANELTADNSDAESTISETIPFPEDCSDDDTPGYTVTDNLADIEREIFGSESDSGDSNHDCAAEDDQASSDVHEKDHEETNTADDGTETLASIEIFGVLVPRFIPDGDPILTDPALNLPRLKLVAFYIREALLVDPTLAPRIYMVLAAAASQSNAMRSATTGTVRDPRKRSVPEPASEKDGKYVLEVSESCEGNETIAQLGLADEAELADVLGMLGSFGFS